MIWAALLATLGLGLGAVVGRIARPALAPGLLGGITGGCGVGALRLAGLGDLGLGTLAAVMVVYGTAVGGVAWLARGGIS